MSAAGIMVMEVLIESPRSIAIVESYHALLRCAYLKLREAVDKRKTTDAECLQLEV